MQVIYKTLNPEWNQTLEFPDNGSKLILHVKDHNAVLPTSSIGNCEVEYQALPPNQTADKWIPLQGVKKGEIHVLVTRRFPELEKKPNPVSKNSASSKARLISEQVKLFVSIIINVKLCITNCWLELIHFVDTQPARIEVTSLKMAMLVFSVCFHLDAYYLRPICNVQMQECMRRSRESIEDGNIDGFESAFNELENVENIQAEYILQLEREKYLLLSKISELDQEMSRSMSAPVKRSSPSN